MGNEPVDHDSQNNNLAKLFLHISPLKKARSYLQASTIMNQR